jgi:hypothetical protein
MAAQVQDLDSAQALAERSALLARRAALRPHRCPQLAEQYAAVRAEDMLTRRRDALAHQLSDASLQQVGIGVGWRWNLGFEAFG